MENFLIILLKNKLCVYKSSSNNAFQVFYINGEEYLNWNKETCSNDFEELKNAVLDICNFDDLCEVGFDVIYHQISTEVIKQLSYTLLPCARWQVFSFEKILPELLLKMKKIKPNESVIARFEENNYMAYMSNEGEIQVCLSDKKAKLNIDAMNIPLVLKNTYEFITNEQDLRRKDIELADITKINKSLNEKISLLKKEVQGLDESLTKAINETIEKDNSELKLLVNKLNSENYELKKVILEKENKINNKESVLRDEMESYLNDY